MADVDLTVVRADYGDDHHCRCLERLLHRYAEHELGSESRIPPEQFAGLAKLLAEFPTAFSVLAFSGTHAVGLINAFFGFSTFAQKRLVNIHDVMVLPEARGQGVAGKMIGKVESIARDHDCCRITLEVLENNRPARRSYEKKGFTRTPNHPDVETLFLQKPL